MAKYQKGRNAGCGPSRTYLTYIEHLTFNPDRPVVVNYRAEVGVYSQFRSKTSLLITDRLNIVGAYAGDIKSKVKDVANG